MNSKGIGTEYRNKLARVIKSETDIITARTVSKILNISLQEAGRILSRWHQQCWVKRVKRGVYIPVAATDTDSSSSVEDPWILAANLFSPGYTAGFSAVKHWDFTDQIFETTMFFTAKKIKSRNPIIGNSRFQLKTISAHKIFGTKNIWRGNIKIAISDPTKTIVDLFDNPSAVGGMRVVQDVFLEYKNSIHYSLNKLVKYAIQMKNKTIFKRLGFLMETLGLKQDIKKWNLQIKISSGYSEFDPGIENDVRVSEWGLKVPKVWMKRND